MKKFLVVLLLIVCLGSFTACGGDPYYPPSGGSSVPSGGSSVPSGGVGTSSNNNGTYLPPDEPEVQESISASILYPWILQIQASDVEYITSKVDVGSVSPHLFYQYNRFKIATDQIEIKDILSKISALKVRRAKDPLWAGGSSEAVTVFLKDGTSHTLTSYYSGFYFDNEYYVYDADLPVCSTDYGRQFLSHAVWDMKLYYNGEEVKGVTNSMCASFLYSLIYTVDDGFDYEQNETFAGYSFKDAYMGEIKIISDNKFAIITENDLNAVCTIVNGKAFSEFLNVE